MGALPIDGSWVDGLSVVFAIVYAASMKRRRNLDTWFDIRVGGLVASGVTFVPIIILALSVFSTKLLELLKDSSRLTLFVAGVVALLALVRNDLNS